MLNEFFNGGGADDSYIIERSLRFDSDDSSHLSRNYSSPGDRRTWTFSAWVKRTKLGATQGRLSGGGTGSGDYFDYILIPAETNISLDW